LQSLQHLVLASETQHVAAIAWRIALERLLLPLVQQLQSVQPESVSEQLIRPSSVGGAATKPAGAPVAPGKAAFDIRLQAISLLFTALLHKLDQLMQLGQHDFDALLVILLKGCGPQLRDAQTADAASEVIVNAMNVLHASGVLQPNSTQQCLEAIHANAPPLAQQLAAHFAQPQHQPQQLQQPPQLTAQPQR